jgi:hypothetical protein
MQGTVFDLASAGDESVHHKPVLLPEAKSPK